MRKSIQAREKKREREREFWKISFQILFTLSFQTQFCELYSLVHVFHAPEQLPFASRKERNEGNKRVACLKEKAIGCLRGFNGYVLWSLWNASSCVARQDMEQQDGNDGLFWAL
jgi:hypothetical protein